MGHTNMAQEWDEMEEMGGSGLGEGEISSAGKHNNLIPSALYLFARINLVF